MKNILKSVSYALVVIFTLSFVVIGTTPLVPFGVDTVSAATGATTPVTPPVKTPVKTPVKKPVKTPVKKPVKTPVKKPVVKTPNTTATGVLKVGNKGNAVKLLQTNLNKYGYKLKVDGIFGKLTLKAVQGYQKKNGFKVIGYADVKTIAKLSAKPTKPTTPAKPTTPTPPTTTTGAVDVISSASVVDNSVDFERSIGKNGKWIIAITKDLSIYKPLVLDGEFKNGKKDAVTGADLIQRKIALYSQDDKHVVTARFTLRAPKLTILSPNASIQHGTFKGDLYVSVPYFKLVDAKVYGNVYFTTKAAQTTFTMDATSSIVGKQELQLGADVVSSASVVDNETAFENSIGINGNWIIAILKDLTFNKPLVLDGKFENGKKDAVTGANLIQRKIALYTQDDKHVVTNRFTLTAPKLTILSPNASIQHGTFKGDLYVSVANFSLVDAKVDGNVYFTSQAFKDTFVMDAKSSVTGKQELKTN